MSCGVGVGGLHPAAAWVAVRMYNPALVTTLPQSVGWLRGRKLREGGLKKILTVLLSNSL